MIVDLYLNLAVNSLYRHLEKIKDIEIEVTKHTRIEFIAFTVIISIKNVLIININWHAPYKSVELHMIIPWITVVWMRFQFLIFCQIFIFKLLPSIIDNFGSYLFCKCFQCWFDSNQTSFLTLLRLRFQTCVTIIYHIINNHRMLYNFSFQETLA